MYTNWERLCLSIPKYRSIRSHVTLSVYDLLGQQVVVLVDKIQPTGEYTVDWNAADYPSGVYYYRIQTDVSTEVKKMLLLR